MQSLEHLTVHQRNQLHQRNPGFAPIRREAILRIAQDTRIRFANVSIDNVAQECGIVLVREDGPIGKDAGFAHIEYIDEPVFVESLARPTEQMRVWGRTEKRAIRSIVINPNAGIPEREIFWHEYFHLFYSPDAVQRSEQFHHRFSTEGALHYQEERRADEFAAAVLVPSIQASANVTEIAERFEVSERIAKCAVRLYRQVSTRAS
jgi:hypothetical protein